VPQAFRTGTVNAMLASPATGVDRQAWDFSRYFYDVNAFIAKNVLVVNARAFAKLSPDTGKAVLASADRAAKRGWELASSETGRLVDTLAKHGMQVEATPPALDASLGTIAATLAREWVKRAGPDGQAILDKASIRR
jgi:TRAP-type C4-dicarboxylate transport system substrate-binding protein